MPLTKITTDNIDFSSNLTFSNVTSMNVSTLNAGDVTITGNLLVSGTTTTVNTATLDIKDLNITVAKGANSTTANSAGITVDGANAQLFYLSADDSLNVNKVFKTTNTVSIGTAAYHVANGNFGVGTSSPSFLLDVSGNARFGANTGQALVRINGGNSGNTSGAGIIFGNAGADNFGIGSASAILGGAYNIDAVYYLGPANNHRFYTSGVERVRIQATQTIGTYLTVNDGVTTTGTFPIFQTYNSSASVDQRYWRIVGGNAGQLTIETVNDAYTSSNARMTITNAGNTGIGTVSPAAALEISRTTSGVYSAIRLTNTTTSGTTPGAALEWAQGGNIKSSIEVNTYGGDYMAFRVGSNTERIRIDGSGNVGIGISSPAYKLHVQDGAALFRASSGAAGRVDIQSNAQTSNEVTLGQGFNNGTDNIAFLYNRANAAFVFGTNNTDRMRITSDGRVVIGASSTSSKFEVAGGTSRFYGGVYVTASAGVEGGEVGLEPAPGYQGWTIDSYANEFRIFTGGATSSSVQIFNAGGGGTAGLTVQGSISKGSGSFRINHPLPELTETHQLVHSFIEGPQADLIYRGVAKLVEGQAIINIDQAAGMTEGTFVLLNREVQCFTSNEDGWTAVKGKVIGNILTITAQDSSCTDNISWLVIGERKDKHMYDTDWTDDNGKVIVEPLKKNEVA